VATLTAEQLQDAQNELNGFLSNTVQYQEEIKENNEKFKQLLADLKACDAKYGATKKETEGLQKLCQECIEKTQQNEQVVATVNLFMHEYESRVNEHLEVLGEMRHLSHSVESRQTEVELTSLEFLRDVDATTDRLRQMETQLNSQYDVMEGYCCRILYSERQQNEMYQRLIQLEQTIRDNALNNLDAATTISDAWTQSGAAEAAKKVLDSEEQLLNMKI
jgi:chromosome segregation ATPase